MLSRRGFAKWLLAMAGGLLLPRGKTIMPRRTGDLFQKVFTQISRGDIPTNEDMKWLRLKLNAMDSLSGRFDTLQQGINPLNITEEDLMGQYTNFSGKVITTESQNITGGEYTKLNFGAQAGGGWGKIFDLDVSVTDGTIYRSGTYIATAFCRFVDSATGHREICINDDTTNTRVARQYGTAHELDEDPIGLALSVSDMYWWPAGTKVFVQVWHNSDTSPLAVDAAHFAVGRLCGWQVGASAE